MSYQPKSYKKFVATAATATLVATAIVPVASAADAKSFTDVSKNYTEAVNYLVANDIASGKTETTFGTTQNITRGDAAVMISKALKLDTAAAPSAGFKDVNARVAGPVNAIVAAGIASGKTATSFAPDANITRQEMAKMLSNAYDMDAGTTKNKFSDVNSNWDGYVDALVANGITLGKTETTFAPTASLTRGEFALFMFRAESLTSSAVEKVTAINNTTVEVTFKEAIEDVKALEFTIDGLTVSSAVVKQTGGNKTVVLTTTAQTADKSYSVNLDGKKVGSFKGVSAVVPTAIKVTAPSLQGVIGNEVTVSAQVTVAEGQSKAGIPVTFNITSDNSNLNNKIEVEALTNAEGVATHTYTRYYAHNDNVAAYATTKSTIVSNGKVYWASAIQLAVSELTVGNELANDTKKTYKVAGKENTTYYVAIKENLNVAPDKITKVKVQDHGTQNFTTPFELNTDSTTGSKEFARVTTNSKGEGTFTLYGTNLSATPIVYLPSSTNTVASDFTYKATALQAQAPTVKFSKVDRLALEVKAEGTANAAQYSVIPTVADGSSIGGRTYTATVKDKEGKIAPEGTIAYLTFKQANFEGSVYVSTAGANFQPVVAGNVIPVRVGKEGKASFRVAGNGKTAFVKPTVFLNTAEATLNAPVKLDDADVQQEGEVTYFKEADVLNAKLSVTDEYGREVTSLNAGKEAFFTYQSVDQNGFAYRPTALTSGSTTQTIWVPVYGKDSSGNEIILGYEQKTITIPGTSVQQYNLAFDVTSTFGNATVKRADGSVIAPSQNLGNTKTYQVVSDAEGKAIVRVTSSAADTVSVNVTGASNFLPTQSASVNFTNSSVVPDLYSGNVATYNSQAGTLTFEGKNPVSIFGNNVKFTKGTEVIANYEAFIALLANAQGTVSITRTVATDGTATFNIYNISNSGIKPVDTAVVSPLAPKVVAEQNVTVGAGAITLTASDLAVSSVGSVLTLGAATSDTATVATATVTDNKLVITPGATAGTAKVTVNVTDGFTTVVTTVNVKVSEVGEGVKFGTVVNATILDNNFGQKVVGFAETDLTAALKGSSYSLELNGVTYDFKENKFSPGRYTVNVDSKISDADIKAATFKTVK